jgi:hypothetical protein
MEHLAIIVHLLPHEVLEPRQFGSCQSHLFRIAVTDEEVCLVRYDHSCPFTHPEYVVLQLLLQYAELVPRCGPGKVYDLNWRKGAFNKPDK